MYYIAVVMQHLVVLFFFFSLTDVSCLSLYMEIIFLLLWETNTALHTVALHRLSMSNTTSWSKSCLFTGLFAITSKIWRRVLSTSISSLWRSPTSWPLICAAYPGMVCQSRNKTLYNYFYLCSCSSFWRRVAIQKNK